MKRKERKIYIDNIDPERALELFLSELDIVPESETVNVRESLNRVTSSPLFARVTSPGYNAAAMDGIAIHSSSTLSASEVTPLELIEGRDFTYINTGNLMPDEYDSVIMIEDIMEKGNGRVVITSPSRPWQHVRMVGEDIVETEMILPSKHRIRPLDLGALISGGIDEIKVYRLPRVGIVPTGSEIVDSISELEPGKIVDSNSYVFEALISELGGIPIRYNVISDDFEKLKSQIKDYIEENDILIINAGSSAGTRDFTAHIISELGEIIVHGMAIKPGKPTILGIIGSKPVIGIPGYPVSSYISFMEFVNPLMSRYYQTRCRENETVKAVLSRRLSGSLKSKEFIRVTLGKINERYIATPLQRGAGVTMSLVRADGIIRIPGNLEGIDSGEEVDVKLLREKDIIEQTLHVTGSHDIILDLIAEEVPLNSSHTGSMGGLMSMMKGECHIAPVHILHEETGEYNIPAVRKYFKERKMCLVRGVKREQGLIVGKGNPRKIESLKDLVREDVNFINRQRGSGTRILLDFELSQMGIDTEKISGYGNEVSSHMSVAAAVKSGRIDTGPGIHSAANVLGLDFIGFAHEEYDFLIPADFMGNITVKRFIKYLKSGGFKKSIGALGGYITENPGEVIKI